MNWNRESVDVLVIGSGLAGLTAAYEALKTGLVVGILSKNGVASPHVIGFSAPMDVRDSPNRFVNDMMTAGKNINDPELAEKLAENSIGFASKLEALGMVFDRDENGYILMRSLGHSIGRLVHHGNVTGMEIMKLLENELQTDNVKTWHGFQAVKLLENNGAVCGAVAASTIEDELLVISAKSVVLATGGGHIAARSTYPVELTFDGFAMAYEVGAVLSDMEFIQHEPLRCVDKRMGMSTTMLVNGGKLLNKDGERFVLKKYESEAMPTKDELSRLIAIELKNGRGGVYVDLTEAPEEAVKQHKTIYERFANAEIDLRKEPVEVAPAAHTVIGGVRIGTDASTGVEGLYAAGEVIGELHGASRLGGNAGTETMVFGEIAGKNAAEYALGKGVQDITANEHVFRKYIDRLSALRCNPAQLHIIKQRAIKLMSEEMGPIRDENGINRILDELELLSRALVQSGVDCSKNLAEYTETANLLLVCRMSCIAALTRKESRGAHFRLDYPATDDLNWRKHIRFSMKDGMKVYDGGRNDS